MSQSQTSNSTNKKFNAINSENVTRIQTKLIPLLSNAEYLDRAKKLISKYETIDSSDIENFLYSKIHKLKNITQHKIRDFITRVEKSQNTKSNSEKSFPYQSDASNFISPSSRGSFSSRSENESNNGKTSLQNDVLRLWKYPVCQKEICELLYANGDLEVCSTRSVAVDFQSLKSSSLRALSDYISEKTSLLDEIRKDHELYLLFRILSNETFDDETTKDIYEILFRYEKIAPNPHGLRSIEITSLRPETKTTLIKLLQRYKGNLRTDDNISTPKVTKTKSAPVISPPVARQVVKNVPIVKAVESEINPTEHYGTFDKEKLRYMYQQINTRMRDEGLSDVMKIIRTYEHIDGTNDNMSINVKKLKDITKHHLYKFFIETSASGSS